MSKFHHHYSKCVININQTYYLKNQKGTPQALIQREEAPYFLLTYLSLGCGHCGRQEGHEPSSKCIENVAHLYLYVMDCFTLLFASIYSNAFVTIQYLGRKRE